MGRAGIVSLANDNVVDWLTALSESLAQNSRAIPVTILPYDDNIEEVSAVARAYGHHMYAGPGLLQADAIGNSYWPGDPGRAHIMRKCCAWLTDYDEFLFMDADIVALRSLRPYFDAFARSGGDFMYFATDISQVYKPGGLCDRMEAAYDTVGFNSGLFMGRSGTLSLDTVSRLAIEAAHVRHDFVDILEQSLLNYCIDVTGLSKVDAHVQVPEFVAAAALMRLKRDDGRLVVRDHRVRESGREVSILHWAGYSCHPLMPYRRIFLRYRLPNASYRQRLLYELNSAIALLRRCTPRTMGRKLRAAMLGTRGFFAARGLARWD